MHESEPKRGRPVGSHNKAVYVQKCEWDGCGEMFEAHRTGAHYCSPNCAYNHRAQKAMIRSEEVIRCRFCSKPVKYSELISHFKKQHRLNLNKTIK